MTFDELCDDDKIFECVAGSHAYGTHTPESDIDLRGVFVVDAEEHLSLSGAPSQVSDATNDRTYYELRRFVELAACCNPNIIELLWTPADCVQIMTPVMKRLVERRSLFVSQEVRQTFGGYALAQIKKARGQNKWVNNPQPEKRPSKRQFCWFVPSTVDESTVPGPWRPLPLEQASVDLRRCRAARVEHLETAYRLYDYGDEDPKGVLRGKDEQLVVESIPVDDEWHRFVGMLIFNERAYNAATKNWRNYWEWRKHRNAARYRSQEAGELDYDAKNMMHCLRLLWSGINLLESGEPIVRYSGEALALLMDVRQGRLAYDEVMTVVEDAQARLETANATTGLPPACDRKRISDFYLGLMEEWRCGRADG